MPDVTASQLMRDFAIRTGIGSEARPPTRYLWTDAFAVCNFLGLFVERRDNEALQRARQLVDQTHRVLGRHRPEDPRRGWISGLDPEEGALHPTAGGLRIGKGLPERRVDQAFEAELEWERDGQYFHYLTKWMQALARMTEVTGDSSYHRWAVELARVAHGSFQVPTAVHDEGGLYWKMSVDLTRPQVPSMGHHDPLDGLLTYQQLQGAFGEGADTDLSTEIRELAKLCAGRSWETDDPLGIGGLLCDARRLAALLDKGGAEEPALFAELLTASIHGLDALLRQHPFERPADSRLAFREFGLSIGLHAVAGLRNSPDGAGAIPVPGDCHELLEILVRFLPLAKEIERFWLDPSTRRSPSWRAHRDINDVMFATSLAPRGFLGGGR